MPCRAESRACDSLKLLETQFDTLVVAAFEAILQVGMKNIELGSRWRSTGGSQNMTSWRQLSELPRPAWRPRRHDSLRRASHRYA